MANTPASDGLKVQQWDAKYFRESLNSSVFKPFMGTATNSVIQVKEDLTKKPGDAVTYSLVNKLNGDGKQGSATLEGNEEDLATRSQKVTIDQYRNGVLVPVLEDQFSAIPLRNAAKDALMDWSMELWRDQTIEALGSINGVAYGDATATQKNTWTAGNVDRVLFGGDIANYSGTHSTALAAIVAGDTLSGDAISLMKRIAKTASPKIRPLKPRNGAKTSDSYVLFASSLCIRDLGIDLAQAHREARPRDKSNPLFVGADYIWDNVAIYEVEDIVPFDGGTVQVAPVYLCGAQALAHAWAKRPQSIEEEFDYKDKQGCAVRQWYGIEKLRFGTENSDPFVGSDDTTTPKDHGIVTGFFSAIAD